MSNKGTSMEELVRNYFSQQGFFAVRSIPYRFDGSDISDIDVWIYGRQSASARIKGIIDVKNKKTPKVFERILWTKGMQLATNCDKAIIVTTDSTPSAVKFAKTLNIPIISKNFIEKLEHKLPHDSRLSMEELVAQVRGYIAHKQDGDWIKHLEDAKSSLISLNSFQSFNRIMMSFQFFAERAEVRPQQWEIATRLSVFTASLACIALDASLEPFVFEGSQLRHKGIMQGVTYGDSGDEATTDRINKVLQLISENMENGRTLSLSIENRINTKFSEVRADIIAEYFARELHSQHLFLTARQLESLAHARSLNNADGLSIEARSILGVFADFTGVNRSIFSPLPSSEGRDISHTSATNTSRQHKSF